MTGSGCAGGSAAGACARRPGTALDKQRTSAARRRAVTSIPWTSFRRRRGHYIVAGTAIRTAGARVRASGARVPASETPVSVPEAWGPALVTPVPEIRTAVFTSGTRVRVPRTAAPASETRVRTPGTVVHAPE